MLKGADSENCQQLIPRHVNTILELGEHKSNLNETTWNISYTGDTR